MRDLTADEAQLFAALLDSGVPATAAVEVFGPDDVTAALKAWPQQPAVQAALEQLEEGKGWEACTDEERRERALRRHYNSLAFYLWNTNYSELTGEARSKADTARQALEAKIAGTAGTNDPLTQFYRELVAKVTAEQQATRRQEPPSPLDEVRVQ